RRFHCFSISLDGYGAGPEQGLEHPLGKGGEAMHAWFAATRATNELFRKPGGNTVPDNECAARPTGHIAARTLGRTICTPRRGPSTDDGWKGWWGEEPPYRSDVFVLTHHPRAPLSMKGGTPFHFITDGIHAALERARASAGGRDVRVGGG